MKQGVVKISQEFLTPIGLKRWVGIEYPVDFSQENVMDAFTKADKMVQDYQSSWQSVVKPSDNELPVVQIKGDVLTGNLIDDIMSCQELIVLEIYKPMLKGRPELAAAYNQRKEELTKAGIKKLTSL